VLSASSADDTGTVLYAGGHGTKFEATRHGLRDASQNVRAFKGRSNLRRHSQRGEYLRADGRERLQ
jgi:hypothetical protein